MGLVGRMRARELSRRTPRFLDRTVARQQSESQERLGNAFFLEVVMPGFVK